MPNPRAASPTCLRERQMLLVIDNCEHLIDAVALLSESILRGAPQVHILATSRESLRAEGEYVQRLDSLDCPPPIAVPTAPRPWAFLRCNCSSSGRWPATTASN